MGEQQSGSSKKSLPFLFLKAHFYMAKIESVSDLSICSKAGVSNIRHKRQMGLVEAECYLVHYRNCFDIPVLKPQIHQNTRYTNLKLNSDQVSNRMLVLYALNTTGWPELHHGEKLGYSCSSPKCTEGLKHRSPCHHLWKGRVHTRMLNGEWLLSHTEKMTLKPYLY